MYLALRQLWPQHRNAEVTVKSVAASRRWQHRLLIGQRQGFFVEGLQRLRSTSWLEPQPPPSFMVLCDGGPPTMERLGAPDQGADPRDQLAIGSIGGDQTNILPLDLTLCLKLILLTLSCSHSITDQCIERASSSRSVAIRFDSYNAPLCFETDTQLGPQYPEIIGFPINPC